MKTKTILMTAGLAVVGLGILGYKKVVELTDTFDAMSISPAGIRNVKIGLGSITFNLDVSFKNPTSSDFNVYGVVATLKRIIINYKGQFLGVAEVNLDEISIPKFGTAIIKDLPVVVDTAAILNNIMTITNLNYNDLQITAVIEALGSEYTITQ